MNLRILSVLFLLCVIAMLVNHIGFDWESRSGKNVEKHFEELITLQKSDLLEWRNGNHIITDFQKRTYCNDKLISWTDDQPWFVSSVTDTLSLVENDKGIFLIRKILSPTNCSYVSVYPVARNYSITNKYLISRLNIALPEKLERLSKEKGEHNFKDLFRYDIKRAPSKAIDAISGLFLIIILLIIYWKVALNKSFIAATASLILLRIISLYSEWTFSIFRFQLFDSLYYKSSFINQSVGDLFVNSLFLFIIVFAWFRCSEKQQALQRKMLVFVYLLIAPFLAATLFSTAWSILDNSQISLDVGKSIEFDLLRVVSYLSILLVALTYFLVFLKSLNLSSRIDIGITLLILFGSSIILYFFSLYACIASLIHAFLFLIYRRTDGSDDLKDFKYENLLLVLGISIGMAGTLAISVYKHHEKSDLDAKHKFANHLLIKKDILGEYYLHQFVHSITNGQMTDERSEQRYDEIVNSELSPYFKKYDIDVLFVEEGDLAGRALYEDVLEHLTEENKSDYDHIYFLDNGSSFTYICTLEIEKKPMLITFSLKRHLPTNVYPSLLTDNKYFTPPDDFDYAVFSGGEIVFQRSKFGRGGWPELVDFENVKLYHEGIEKNEKHYFGVETTDNRIILIISRKYSNRMQLTNFSFFFLILFFSLGVFILLHSIKPDEISLNFTGKIQLYLGLVFIVPLFSAGFALLSSLNTSYREEIDRSYLKKALYISKLLTTELSELGKFNEHEISSRLTEIANFIQTDLSFYDEKGSLVATSQQEIFDLDLQSELINPIVFEELLAKENQGMIANGAIGSLDYRVSFATVMNTTDEHIGFIAMPFFDSKNHLRRQQLEVFGNLTIIFGLIFILAIVFGNTILNNLLHPLRMVADKIRQTTLQEKNRPILFESSDEIGSLVRDYNQMLVKLEKSKAALARNQKETAWKEIARQVAHEIKNPLTPMQLKIQQLMRKHEKGSKDYEIFSALMTQVDTLSQLAGSFSAFAEMPAPNNHLFNFDELILQVIKFYRTPEVLISIDVETGVQIKADEGIFRRILNNIVLNAIQSVENKSIELKVELKRKKEKCLLLITDNGKGIPEELKDKIFLNYFSTKFAGSGIGLALAKKGIESAGGSIWFESAKDLGTTFFISMPLADP